MDTIIQGPGDFDNRDVSDLEGEDDGEIEDVEFNCEPVKKTFITVDEIIQESTTGPIRFSAGLFRDAAIKFNSTRQATLHMGIKGLATGYVDQDTSGNYDPALEGKRTRSGPLRVRYPRKHVKEEKQHRHRFGHGFLVVLPLRGKLLEYAKTLPLGPFSMLSDVSDIESSESLTHDGPRVPTKRRVTAVRTARNDGKTIDKLTPGHPQRRGCKKCFEIGDNGCSMIDDKHNYPCDACNEEGILCEPIVSPELQRSCEHSRETRLKCSYRENDGRGMTSCDGCAGNNISCIAGPLQENLEHRYVDGKLYIPKVKEKTKKSIKGKADESPTDEEVSLVKIKHDTVLLNEVLPRPIRDPSSRVLVACNQCRAEGLRCNLKREDSGPCRPCKRAGEVCQFVYPIVPKTSIFMNSTNQHAHPQHYTQYLLNERLNRKTFTTRKGNQTRLERSTKNAAKLAANSMVTQMFKAHIHLGRGETLGVKHIYIRTAFSHPVRFNYQPDPDNRHPCSWCYSPIFGLFGYGMKDVEVIPFDIGYEEINGGHGQDDKDPSKMCVICTFQRLKMIACHSHLMMPLQNTDINILDMVKLEQSFGALMQHDESGGRLAKETIWCSICITPAEYSCCVGSTGVGCGLNLCQGCNDLLTRLTNGTSTGLDKIKILDVLINLWKEDQWKMNDESEKGDLRADAEFLLSTGELFTRTSKGMRIVTLEEDPFKEQYRALKRDGRDAVKNPDARGSVSSKLSTGSVAHTPALPQLNHSSTVNNSSILAKPTSPNTSGSIFGPSLSDKTKDPGHTQVVSRKLAAEIQGTDERSLSSAPKFRSDLISMMKPLSRTMPPKQSSDSATSHMLASNNPNQAVSAPFSTSPSRLLQSACPLSQAVVISNTSQTRPRALQTTSSESPTSNRQPPHTTIPGSGSDPKSATKSPAEPIIKSVFGGPIAKQKPESSTTNSLTSIRERLQDRQRFQRKTSFKPSYLYPQATKSSTPPTSQLGSTSSMGSLPFLTPTTKRFVAAKAGSNRLTSSGKKKIQEVHIDLTKTDDGEWEEKDDDDGSDSKAFMDCDKDEGEMINSENSQEKEKEKEEEE